MKTQVEPGTWHKLVVEVHGPTMIAQLDGDTPLNGENPSIDVDKIDFGIPVVKGLVKGLKAFAIQ